MTDLYKLTREYVELHQCKSKSRITVIGDFILDKYTWCEDKRPASDEAFVLEVQKQHCYPGGAGNLSLNLSLLGMEVQPCGVIGGDSEGQLLLQILEQYMKTDFLFIQNGRTTTVKNRLLTASGKPRSHPLRVDSRSCFFIPEMQLELLQRHVLQSILSSDHIVLSDYNQGLLLPELIEKVMTEAKRSNKAIHIDSRGRDINMYRGATTLMSTLTEINQLLGTTCSTLEELIPLLLVVMRKQTIDNIVVKHNKYGSMLLSNGNVTYAEPFVKEVDCAVGAGDSFLAGFVSARTMGMKEIDSFLIGNMFAGIAVSQPETYAVAFHDLARYVEEEVKNWKVKRWNHYQKAFE